MAAGSIVAAAIPAIASYIGGEKANEVARRGQDQQNAITQAALKRLADLDIPVQQKLELEDAIYQGDLNLDDLQLQSEMGNVSVDPRFQQAQMDALAKMGELSEGGMLEADKVALQQIQGQQARDNNAQQQAILQNMAERGVGGSGQEMAAKLQAQQSGADRSAMQGAQINADAQQRALQAMMQGGQMAGNMRGQSFSEQSDIAKSKDSINKFNSGMIGGARQMNIARKDQIEAGRVGNRNDETSYNINAGQRDYQNKVTKATGQNAMIPGMVSTIGTNSAANAAAAAAPYKAIGDLLGTGITEYNKKD